MYQKVIFDRYYCKKHSVMQEYCITLEKMLRNNLSPDRKHFIWLVKKNVLSSLLMCKKIINNGPVKKFVKSLFIFWIIILLDLEQKFKLVFDLFWSKILSF